MANIPFGNKISLPYAIEVQSLAICRIELLRKGKQISHGSGFLIRGEDQKIGLYTCWHVLTCRNPRRPGLLLDNVPDSPDSIRISYFTSNLAEHRLSLPIYDSGGQPIWLESNFPQTIVDCVLIDLSNNLNDCVALNDSLENEISFEHKNIGIHLSKPEDELRVSANAYVVGYPTLPDDHDSKFPIWKQGSVASEPRLRLPTFLIDATTKSGFSGGPVLCDTGKLNNIKTLSKKLPLDLIGVYSSHFTDPKYDLSIGVVWKMSCAPWFDSLRGQNPFPPAP